jgi:SAM-dependent methyltransferase
MSYYYPTSYYSFRERPIKRFHLIKHYANQPVMHAYLRTQVKWLRRILSRFRRIPDDVEKLAHMPLRLSWKILDVGCGSGERLVLLHRFGFRNLEGVDKYLHTSVTIPSAVKIWRGEMSDLKGQYDLVMSHHVFEHFDDPREALREMMRLTRPGGYIFIRMPNARSWARTLYGTYWVAWDAPRHVYVHTPESIEILAREARLDLIKIFYDSNIYQFAGSEQYVRGIFGNDARFKLDGNGVVFSEQQVTDYQHKARELNCRGQGDWMCVVLRRATTG